jgi:ankyrin repeat protein
MNRGILAAQHSCPFENYKRVARYYKCKKRSRRRGRGGCCLMDCALSQLQLPAPLPFRRRRREEQQEQEQENSSKLAADERNETSGAETAVSTSTYTSEPQGKENQQQRSVNEQQATEHPQEANPAIIETTDSTAKKHRKSKRSMTQQARRSSLIDLARMQHWSSVLERSAYKRKEARHQDADGLLPLHWAASGGPPVEVVDALLQAYPKGASAVDQEGSTALHFACHYGANASVMEVLLRTHPDSIRMQDKHGRSPLYHAVDKRANLQVIELLVHADPSLITKPCLPPNPELAAKVRARDGRPLEHRTPLFMAWAQVVMASRNSSRTNTNTRLWEKSDLLLQAAYAYHTSQRITYRLVHATVRLDSYLPPQLLSFALELYPEHLTARDEEGRVPLAVAAATHQLFTSRSRDVVTHLLQAHPEAAQMVDTAGNTPLALALACGKAWNAGVQELFTASPEVIGSRDGSTKLYPALQAAATIVGEEEDEPARSQLMSSSSRIYSSFPLRQDTTKTDKVKKREEQKKGDAAASSNEVLCSWLSASVEVRHLSTIFELLRADPSLVK